MKTYVVTADYRYPDEDVRRREEFTRKRDAEAFARRHLRAGGDVNMFVVRDGAVVGHCCPVL